MPWRGTCHIWSDAQWCKSARDNSYEYEDHHHDNDKAVYNATEDRKSNLHQIEDCWNWLFQQDFEVVVRDYDMIWTDSKTNIPHL